jgi:2,4-didehydro-3-deoxy-L-rhamnonate hydrolase
MKLIRFGPPGREKPGLLQDDGTRIDVSAFGRDYDEAFFGGTGLDDLRAWVKENAVHAPRVDATVRLGPPVCRPSKIVCIGLNFRDHAAETGADIPTEPVIFFKASSALCGPDDPLVIPRGATKVDWEVELAFVIGRVARYVHEERGFEHIAGYALHNDYSERSFQLERGGQWSKGKSADTFAPLGPFLATRDEIKDPQALPMWLKVNGEVRQKSNTSQQIFDCGTVLSYLSRFMTLLPGDVVSTGTPPGVGLGMKPEPVYLKAGDVVELGIDGLGTSRQQAVEWR